MPLTANKNFLTPIGFQLKIDSTRYPNLEYFCSGVTLPNLSVSEVDVPYGSINVSEPGDRLTFGDLTIKFNVTEDMDNYIETYDWIRSLVVDDYAHKADATLAILTSHNNVSREVKFDGIFPVDISEITFSATETEAVYVEVNVTFKYTQFKFLTPAT
jgi:hypothetical protein